jgi:hypothetical protein
MTQYKFFEVTDLSGSLKTVEVTQRPLTKSMLSDKESYILAMHDLIYVW